MTREEFIQLYEKFLNGRCSPGEQELLNSYLDKMKLLDNKWEDDFNEGQIVHDRIWKRLEKSIESPIAPGKTKKDYGWLKVAATILVTFSIGLAVFKYAGKTTRQQKPVLVAKHAIDIPPGGNKAYLTLNDGSRITLSNARNGKLAVAPGIQVTKEKDGLIVYHFNNSANDKSSDSAGEFNTITTPRGGQYELVLADGSKVMLNAESSLRFPVAFSTNERRVELTGEAYFEVAKNKAKPFIVHANNTDIRVLGTHFDVNAYNDDHMLTTTLLEGSVRMESGKYSAVLKPGQQGSVSDNPSSILVKEADIDEVMAWKNGIFLFNDEDLNGVMKKIARWYNVEVEFKDQAVKKERYSGSVSRFSKISQLLRKLQELGGVEFQIEPDKVVVMKK
jgi:transmembrane sensor